MAFQCLPVRGRRSKALAARAALARRGIPETVPPFTLRMPTPRAPEVVILDRQAQALRLWPLGGPGLESGGENVYPSTERNSTCSSVSVIRAARCNPRIAGCKSSARTQSIVARISVATS